jgi:hypothetical protein
MQEKNTKVTQRQRRRYGCGSIDCGDGTRIDVHMANNAGRGTNNVTLTRVAVTVARPAYTRQYHDADIIARTQTGGWCGHWSITKKIEQELML